MTVLRSSALRRAACAALLALGAPALSSCKPARTQVTIVLDTDIPECALPQFHFRAAYDWDGFSDPLNVTDERMLDRGTSMAQVSLPASFYVESQAGKVATIVIDNFPSVTLQRVVRVPFLQDRNAVATVVLRAACLAVAPTSAGHPCPTGMVQCTMSQSCATMQLTCGNNGLCRDIDLTTEDLTDSDGGVSLPDALLRDASDPHACDDAGAQTDASGG